MEKTGLNEPSPRGFPVFNNIFLFLVKYFILKLGSSTNERDRMYINKSAELYPTISKKYCTIGDGKRVESTHKKKRKSFSDKWFNIGKNILLLFLIIYVGSRIDWLFTPVRVAFQTVFIPLILTGFLFYLLRPFVKLLNKKIPKGLAILIVYIILGGTLTFGLVSLGPILQDQIMSLANNIPNIIASVEDWVLEVDLFNRISQLEDEQFINLDEYIETITNTLNTMGRGLISGLGSLVGTVASVLFVLLLLPILLFYILKDSSTFYESFIRVFHPRQQKEVRSILEDIDHTLSSYIQGQGIVCLFVGILCFVAFLVIGLEYALLLGVIAGVTNLIPYFGPWIGSVPAVMVAIFTSPYAALATIIAVVVIQQIESNLIAPQVIGKKLKIHPIMIIFLILIAAQLIGLIGMILAVPFYATFRVLVVHGMKIWMLRGYEEESEA
ncbi:AI-2E family transporter [Alkalibacterium sp. AK22]|uniref:AI-2E family transporter n=1 Tax=Alkalibacterium sp. AK22 TaxID=1229520 RepID=UPI0018CC0294|nr:AI-2E family transporter [Alkalibacterium sp. AK22]